MTYSLSSTDAALFNIDTSTGVVTFKTLPDFEAPADADANNSYDVTVSASDGTITPTFAQPASALHARCGSCLVTKQLRPPSPEKGNRPHSRRVCLRDFLFFHGLGLRGDDLRLFDDLRRRLGRLDLLWRLFRSGGRDVCGHGSLRLDGRFLHGLNDFGGLSLERRDSVSRTGPA